MDVDVDGKSGEILKTVRIHYKEVHALLFYGVDRCDYINAFLVAIMSPHPLRAGVERTTDGCSLSEFPAESLTRRPILC
jgi:hypothetical protein